VHRARQHLQNSVTNSLRYQQSDLIFKKSNFFLTRFFGLL
jgi:hypothetical protein